MINLLRSLFVWETLYYCLYSDILWTMIWHMRGAKSITTHFLYCWNLAKSTRCSNRLPQEPPYLIKILQSKRNATEIIFFSKSLSSKTRHWNLEMNVFDFFWLLFDDKIDIKLDFDVINKLKWSKRVWRLVSKLYSKDPKQWQFPSKRYLKN